MPCNLAVTITKAAVKSEHLLNLLKTEAIQPVVEAYLRDRFPAQALYSSVDGNSLEIWVEPYTITITTGTVQVSVSSAAMQANTTQLAEELQQLLAVLADELFAAQLGNLFAEYGATAQQVTVENQGVTQHAYQFTFNF